MSSISSILSATQPSLDGAVADFGSLVGLVLTLVTLFTGLRDTEVRTMAAGPRPVATRERLRREVWVAAALAIVTLLLFASGLPLYVRVAAHFSTSSDHSLRWVFLIVWPLLLPLCRWQLSIGARARDAARG